MFEGRAIAFAINEDERFVCRSWLRPINNLTVVGLPILIVVVLVLLRGQVSSQGSLQASFFKKGSMRENGD